MINQHSLDAVDSRKSGIQTVMPLYDSYCFSNLNMLFSHLLGTGAETRMPLQVLCDSPHFFKKIVFIYLDAFGWDVFEKINRKSSLLARILEEGAVSKITSQFPSSTAPHVTSIHTGLGVGESGIYEWFQYVPEVDNIITPLLFSLGYDRERNRLLDLGFDPEKIFPTATFYHHLREHGIESYIFQSSAYTPSPISDVVFQGSSKVVPYLTIPEACTNLVEHLKAEQNPSYFFLYLGNVDSIGHLYGVDSRQYTSEILSTLSIIEHRLIDQITDQRETLLVISTDHGMSDLQPDDVFYLNQEIPEIIPMLRKNRAGETILPAGGCRDMFLHVKEECIGDFVKTTSERLNQSAGIYKTPKLIVEGWFGREVSKRFVECVGDLLILPEPKKGIWWLHGEKPAKHIGHHGGASISEMEIPLLMLDW